MKITKVEVFRLPTANSKQNSPIGCRIHPLPLTWATLSRR